AEESNLSNLASPVQEVRMVFDLMASATADDWATIATRMGRVPAAIDGYLASLRYAAARADVRPRRQAQACIEQCAKNTDTDGFFGHPAASAHDVPDTVRADLERGAQAASDAYVKLGAYLADELLPVAPEPDAVGQERYALFSQQFLGSAVDLEETYIWGQK